MKYCEGVQIWIAQYLVTRDHRAHFKMVGLKKYGQDKQESIQEGYCSTIYHAFTHPKNQTKQKWSQGLSPTTAPLSLCGTQAWDVM